MRIIAESRQAKLGYVLSENLREQDETLSAVACESLLELARWVNQECRLMHQRGGAEDLTLMGDHASGNDSTIMSAPTSSADLTEAYNVVMTQRPEVESAIARALDWARTKHIPELLKAALLLCDYPQSRVLAILKTARHGGQASMVRKLQQPPAAEHVEAFLLGASHGHLRSNFASAMAQIADPRVLDAMLRRSHWLCDQQLRVCVAGVQRGVWWDEHQLQRDLEPRDPTDASRIAAWMCASGHADTLQDERLLQVLRRCSDNTAARLRVLRAASTRPKQLSGVLLKEMLSDTDERLARIAARELIRRKPPEYEAMLLQRMTSSPDSVRRVIGRAIGRAGFEQFWNRFDRMDHATRKQAGRAMMKILPDAPERIGRYLAAGTVDQRVRAMQLIQELELAERYHVALRDACKHQNSKVRSKAVSLLIDVPQEATADILERVLSDTDARVRANAIEVLEARRSVEYVPMLTERARSMHNRERANAIKALHRMKVGNAAGQLQTMLRDGRSEHRISALWTLRHIGLWNLLSEVGVIAQQDQNLRVRRYAVAILKNTLETLRKAGLVPTTPASKVA